MSFSLRRCVFIQASPLRWHAYNCNFLPANTGLHHARKCESFQEFQKLCPVPPEEFLAKISQAASDANVAVPSCEDESDELYRAHLLENPDWCTKGPVFRMSAWFSIIPASAHKDRSFTLWRTYLRWLAKALLGQGKWCKVARDSATLELAKTMPSGDSKEDHKQRLKKLKQHFSNSLLLAAVVTCNYNFFQHPADSDRREAFLAGASVFCKGQINTRKPA